MADCIFIQKSRIGLKIFQLKDDLLVISSRRSGRGETSSILLKTISLEYERVARRLTILIVVPFVLCVLFLLVGLIVMIHGNDLQVFSMWPFFFAVVFFILTLRGIPRVDTFQFYDHWRKPLFYVVRENRQAQECDDFMRTLLDRIECFESGQLAADETAAQPESVVQLSSPDEARSMFSGDYRWKASIAAGAFSAGLPWVGAFVGIFEELPFPLVFMGTVAGIGFCIFSYQAKERLRHLSLIGVVLSMIAPLFY